MSIVVLDASTAVAWMVASQATPQSNAVFSDPFISAFEVPHIFPAEIRNALIKLERRGLCSEGQSTIGLASLESFTIIVRPAPSAAGYAALMLLAREMRLSLFDAHYLDLAMRGGRTLICRDRALIEAARHRGVAVRSTLADAS